MQYLIENLYKIYSTIGTCCDCFSIVNNTSYEVIELEKHCGWRFNTIEKVKSYMFFIFQPVCFMVLSCTAASATMGIAECYLNMIDMPIIIKFICFLGYERLIPKVIEELNNQFVFI